MRGSVIAGVCLVVSLVDTATGGQTSLESSPATVVLPTLFMLIQSRSVIVQPPSPAMAESSTRNIENAVAACVAVVHSLGSEHFGSQYFDAYYNPADHKVYNNIQYVYQQQYLFLFNKCMVSHGFPLTE
jgi:hypothetical protein